jgi:hypothetical protein
MHVAELLAGNGGRSGNFFAQANNLALGARIDLAGTATTFYDVLEIEACNVTLLDTARIASSVALGTNRIAASGTLTVNAGASLAANRDEGTNRFICRDSAQPPVVLGSVTPAPMLEVDTALAPCP